MTTAKKPSAGDPLEISAGFVRDTIDLLNAKPFQRRHMVRESKPDALDLDTVLVRNDSGEDVRRFGVLGIDDVLIAPSDTLIAFQNQPALACVTPVEDDHRGKFVVAIEPIADGKIGRAAISGVVAVQLLMSDGAGPTTGYAFADVLDGDNTRLQPSAGGNARILYVQPGAGTKWALVLLGSVGGLNFCHTVDAIAQGQTGPVEIYDGLPGQEVATGRTVDNVLNRYADLYEDASCHIVRVGVGYEIVGGGAAINTATFHGNSDEAGYDSSITWTNPLHLHIPNGWPVAWIGARKIISAPYARVLIRITSDIAPGGSGAATFIPNALTAGMPLGLTATDSSLKLGALANQVMFATYYRSGSTGAWILEAAGCQA